jgi:hypothetical protein
MTSADGIRKLGFRRWYERQLIESHAWLVTGLLSLILAIACFEEFSVRGPVVKALLMVAVIAGAGVLCLAAFRRYQFMLVRAERLAEQSTCGECGVYGRLRLIASRLAAAVPDVDGREPDEELTVECRKCGHQWTMGSGAPG